MASCSKLWALLLLMAYVWLSASYKLVPLPDGVQPEGVTAGSASDLWVACLSGAITHVDLASNTSTIVHREPGVALSGAKFCPEQQVLFAAGSLSGKAYIFHMQKTGRTSGGGQQLPYMVAKREVVQLAKPLVSYINDVALSNDRAYFTDSFRAVIYSIPRFAADSVAEGSGSSDGTSIGRSRASTRPVLRHPTGSFFATQLGQFRANGLAVYASNASADTLLVANTHTGNLYSIMVDKAAAGATRKSSQPSAAAAQGQLPSLLGHLVLHGLEVQPAAVRELALPTIKGGKASDRVLLDGVWVANSSVAYVADNYNNRVWGISTEAGLRSARLSCLFQDSVLGVPTTLTFKQGLLWATNAHLDTCFPFLPCPKHKFEMIGIDPQECKPWQ